MTAFNQLSCFSKYVSPLDEKVALYLRVSSTGGLCSLWRGARGGKKGNGEVLHAPLLFPASCPVDRFVSR